MTIEEFITKFNSWLEKTAASNVDPAVSRPWATLDLTSPLTQNELRNLFDRSKLNEEYAAKYNEKDQAKQEPYAFLQVELDAMYAAHKSMVMRHRSRLMFYRDDCSAKQFRVKSALLIALGKFIVDERRAKAT